QTRKCLICEVPISMMQLGIDACRACAVFYRRAQRSTRKFTCKGISCVQDGRVSDCRSCRYYRMRELFTQAKLDNDLPSIKDTRGEKEREQGGCSESDHRVPPMTSSTQNESILRCQHCAPSISGTTPVIDRIRNGYNVMTRLRKLSELSIRPPEFSTHPTAIDDNTFQIIPSTHGMKIRTRKILTSSLFDFASIAFPEFAALKQEDKWRHISACTERVHALESCYRAAKMFPDDETIFISYTTTLGPGSYEYYITDTPLKFLDEKTKEELKKNIVENVPIWKREWGRIDPTEDEFLIMLALTFWSTDPSALPTDEDVLSRLATEYRSVIMQDLHAHYRGRGLNDYATRIGEIFCLVTDSERIASLISEDYSLLHLHSEQSK
ncbi:hypothetical protein PMAYCL1PPCAC_22035, partial [Pristionchus mayeri]